jgi:hypothetical protein
MKFVIKKIKSTCWGVKFSEGLKKFTIFLLNFMEERYEEDALKTF